MACGRKRVRFTLDVKFSDDVAKATFVTRLNAVRDRLTPPGSPPLENYALMNALFELAEHHVTTPQSTSTVRTVGSFMQDSG